MQARAFFDGMGFELEFCGDVGVITPLLRACGLEPLDAERTQGNYLVVTTRAGGVAACVGWSWQEHTAVVHSLAVAPSTRGGSVGAALLVSAMHEIMDNQPVESIYIHAPHARHFFSMFGFVELYEDTLPEQVKDHADFDEAVAKTCMVKHYKKVPRGLDKCAFGLIHNATKQATLPIGSVLFYAQSNARLETVYKGGPVVQGHMIGNVTQDTIDYLWHSYLTDQRLMQGSGRMIITQLEDGRRELREVSPTGHIELVLREA